MVQYLLSKGGADEMIAKSCEDYNYLESDGPLIISHSILIATIITLASSDV